MRPFILLLFDSDICSNHILRAIRSQVFTMLDGKYGSEWSAPIAAKHGHCALVKLHLDHDSDKNIHLSFSLAARYGHIHILQWLFKSTSTIPPHLPAEVVRRGNGCVYTMQFLYGTQLYTVDSHVADVAAANNFLDIVWWLHTVGVCCSESGMRSAIRYGNTSMIQWLISKNARCRSSTVMDLLGKHGMVEPLKQLHATGIPFSKNTVAIAVEQGYLNVVEYAEEIGLTYDANACMVLAFTNNHHQIFDYLERRYAKSH